MSSVGCYIGIEILFRRSRSANQLYQLSINHIELPSGGVAFKYGSSRLILRVSLEIVVEIGTFNGPNPVPSALKSGTGTCRCSCAAGGGSLGGGRSRSLGCGLQSGRRRSGGSGSRLTLRVV